MFQNKYIPALDDVPEKVNSCLRRCSRMSIFLYGMMFQNNYNPAYGIMF